MESLPCGCHMGTDVIDGVNTLLYEPCALDCKYYLFMLAESERQGNPVHVIDAR